MHWLEWVTAVVAAVAAVAAIRTWTIAKRSFKRDLINDLFREYGTRKMGEAVAALHESFRASTGCLKEDKATYADRQTWINYYKAKYKDSRELHFQRRKVSVFYQKMAYFGDRDRYVGKIVREMWGGRDLSLVKNILLPIETVAIPQLLGNDRVDFKSDYPPPMWLLWRFWMRGPRLFGVRLDKFRWRYMEQGPVRFVLEIWRRFLNFLSEEYY